MEHSFRVQIFVFDTFYRYYNIIKMLYNLCSSIVSVTFRHICNHFLNLLEHNIIYYIEWHIFKRYSWWEISNNAKD